MESVFTSHLQNKRKRKRNKTPRFAMGIFLSASLLATMVLRPFAAEGAAVYASEGLLGRHTEDCFPESSGEVRESVSGNEAACADTGQENGAPVQNDLDFSGAASDLGDLDTDGYHWDTNGKKLSLKNVSISGTVTLPDATVEIETEGACSIHALAIAGGAPQQTKLTFSGTGGLTDELTIESRINISGGNDNALTVGAGAHVLARGGIGIGSSGGVDSVVTIKGTLTTEGDSISIDDTTYYNSAIHAGKVIVGGGGQLNISGRQGVLLSGMWGGGPDYDFTNVFTVENGGCFTATNCEDFIVKAESTGPIPDGTDADQVFVIPENYLPTDCDVKKSKGGNTVDFVKKGTDQVYTGNLTIHETHVWSDWNKDETGHWKDCVFNGCDKREDEGPHSFGSDTWTCVCGSKLDVVRKDAEGLTYNGQEQEPDVTVQVDGAELDASKYNIVYSNNTNAGGASATVTGKDGLTFERTVEFWIAKATPRMMWEDGSQNVTYTGSPAQIDGPTVKLAGTEEFAGEISYYYKAAVSRVGGPSGYTKGLPTDAGEYAVKAGIAEQGNYTAAESTDLMLTVEKAENAPNMPSNTMNVERECERVSDVKLPEKWQWQETDRDTLLSDSVPKTATAVYVGEDKGNYKNETVAVTITRADCNHTHTELRDVVAATCQKQGYSGDTYCLECGNLLERGTQTALIAHSGGTANCVSGKICTVCGTEYTPKDSAVHAHTQIRGQKSASCTEDGNTGDTFCADCDTKINSGTVIPATGHEWKVTGEVGATTTSEGKRIYTCDKCGATREETIPKLPEEEHKHEYGATVVKEASCTQAGEKRYICSCGDSYTEGIPAYGHSFRGEITTQPTVFAEGVKTYTCSRCGDTYTEPVPKLDNPLPNPDKPDTPLPKPDNPDIPLPKPDNPDTPLPNPDNPNTPLPNPEESEKPPVEDDSDKGGEQGGADDDMDEPAVAPEGPTGTNAGAKSPQTGQPGTLCRNIITGVLAIIAAFGVFFLAKRKKGE